MMTSVMGVHDIDVSEFLNVLDSCEGNVFLVTREGDKINLKSRLSQLPRRLSSVTTPKMSRSFSD